MSKMIFGQRRMVVLALGVAAGGAALFAAADPADARIRCNGNYQVVGGNEIATPFCQDENLARVAREFGMRVTGSQIRGSESIKARACRLAGYDNRVSDACAAYRLDSQDRRRH